MSQRVNILVFAGHMDSVANTQLCLFSGKDIDANEHGRALTKVCLQKQAGDSLGNGPHFLTPGPDCPPGTSSSIALPGSLFIINAESQPPSPNLLNQNHI